MKWYTIKSGDKFTLKLSRDSLLDTIDEFLRSGMPISIETTPDSSDKITIEENNERLFIITFRGDTFGGMTVTAGAIQECLDGMSKTDRITIRRNLKRGRQ